MSDPKRDDRPIGILAVCSGVIGVAGVVSLLPMLLCAPVAIVSGVVSIRRRHKIMGWTGVALGILAIVAVLYLWIPFFSNTSND